MSMALHIDVVLRVNQLIPYRIYAVDWTHHHHTLQIVLVVMVVNDRLFKVNCCLFSMLLFDVVFSFMLCVLFHHSLTDFMILILIME